MRLIDADKWAQFYSEERNRTPVANDYEAGQNDALDQVDTWMEEQTTVDAVVVTRCKDCKCSDYSGCSDGMIYCMEHSFYMDENGYCSEGEREEDDGKTD